LSADPAISRKEVLQRGQFVGVGFMVGSLPGVNACPALFGSLVPVTDLAFNRVSVHARRRDCKNFLPVRSSYLAVVANFQDERSGIRPLDREQFEAILQALLS